MVGQWEGNLLSLESADHIGSSTSFTQSLQPSQICDALSLGGHHPSLCLTREL